MLRTLLLRSLNCSACDVGRSPHGRLQLSVLSSAHFARTVAARPIRIAHFAPIVEVRPIRIVHFPPFSAAHRALRPISCKGPFSCKGRGEVHVKLPIKCALRRALLPFSCTGTCTSLNSLHEFALVQGIGGSARHRERITAKCTPSLTYTIQQLQGSARLTAAGAADAAAARGTPPCPLCSPRRAQSTLGLAAGNSTHRARPR